MDYKKQVQLLQRQLEEIGISTNSYTSITIKRIFGEDGQDSKEDNFNLCIVEYLIELHRVTLTNDFKNIPFKIKRQLKKAYKKGLLSIYLTIVGHMLSTIFQPDSYTDIYLGYIEAEGNTTSLHGFIVINDKVIDVTCLTELEGVEAIDELVYGRYPEELKTFGWRMNGEIYTLFNLFNADSSKAIDAFIKGHSNTMLLILGQSAFKVS